MNLSHDITVHHRLEGCEKWEINSSVSTSGLEGKKLQQLLWHSSSSGRSHPMLAWLCCCVGIGMSFPSSLIPWDMSITADCSLHHSFFVGGFGEGVYGQGLLVMCDVGRKRNLKSHPLISLLPCLEQMHVVAHRYLRNKHISAQPAKGQIQFYCYNQGLILLFILGTVLIVGEKSVAPNRLLTSLFDPTGKDFVCALYKGWETRPDSVWMRAQWPDLWVYISHGHWKWAVQSSCRYAFIWLSDKPRLFMWTHRMTFNLSVAVDWTVFYAFAFCSSIKSEVSSSAETLPFFGVKKITIYWTEQWEGSGGTDLALYCVHSCNVMLFLCGHVI